MTNKPADCINVTIEENEYKLLMTYGLLSKLAGMVGSQEQLLDAGFAHESRDEMIKAALTKRGRSGAFEEDEIDLDNLDLDTAEEILEWVTGHLTAFFMKRLRSAQSGMQSFKEVMTEITEALSDTSPAGSQD